MAETGGPVSRSIALAKYLKNEGHQVATLIVPGKVFERKFNAKSISDKGAAIVISEKEFTASEIRTKANLIFQNNAIKINAEKLGQKLSERGGFGNILKVICGNN